MFGKEKSKGSAIDTLISTNVEVTGDIHFSGGIQVDGKVMGNIEADREAKGLLRVSEQGSIHGDLRAPYMEINGRVEGDVYAAEHLELSENACVTGNVYYSSIEMLRGAQVNGSLLYKEDVIKEAAAASGHTTFVDSGGILST